MTKQQSPLEVEIYPALPTLTIAYLAAGPTPTRPSTLQRLSAHSKLRIRIAQLGITSPVLHSRLCPFLYPLPKPQLQRRQRGTNPVLGRQSGYPPTCCTPTHARLAIGCTLFWPAQGEKKKRKAEGTRSAPLKQEHKKYFFSSFGRQALRIQCHRATVRLSWVFELGTLRTEIPEALLLRHRTLHQPSDVGVGRAVLPSCRTKLWETSTRRSSKR